jgi:hypothetical protein
VTGDRGAAPGDAPLSLPLSQWEFRAASTMRQAFQVALSHECMDAMPGRIRNLFTVIGKLQRPASDSVS